MSASPTKAMPELIKQASDTRVFLGSLTGCSPTPARPSTSAREALQALLAFSSLHDQIRRRREQAVQAGGTAPAAGEFEDEQFVLDEVLQLVAERAMAITGADGVAIALASGDQIVCRGSAGSIAPDRGARLDPNSSFSGACFRNAQIVRCDDSETDPRVDVEACRRLGAQSMVAVPLSGRHRVVGLLEAFSSDAFGFNDSDVRALNLMGELVLAATKPEEKEQLEQISQSVAMESVSTPQVEGPARPESLDPAEEPTGFTPAQAPAPAMMEAQAPQEPEFVEEHLSPAPAPADAAASTGRPGLVVVLVVVLVAALFGAGLWWKLHRKIPGAQAQRQTIAAVTARQIESVAEALPSVPLNDIDTGNAPATAQQLAVLPKVTGIRHWSATDSSTVVIDLQDQVQYEAHRLASPDRIYFDLHDTALAPGLDGRIIEIGDALLARVRIAQPMPGVTRIVLDTVGASNFAISLETNPYRLVAELRAIGAKAQSKAQFDLFRAPPAPENDSLAKTTHSATRDEGQLRPQVPKIRVVVDPGHGGWDLGTVGRKGLLEKDLVLDIAQRLGDLLGKRLNAEVVYTRQDDSYIPLEDRAGIANQAQADLFVSIHANYSDSESARGVETYYTNTFSSVNARSRSTSAAAVQNVNWAKVDIREKVQQSRRFAASVQHALYGALAQRSPSIRDRGVKEASYVVLTGTEMPAILAEVSFVSSPSDESKLQVASYREQIAAALYRGVASYAAHAHHVRIASTSGKPAGK